MKCLFSSGMAFSPLFFFFFPDGWTEAVMVIRFKILSELNSGLLREFHEKFKKENSTWNSFTSHASLPEVELYFPP